jgi:hypothetical protein
MKRTELKRKTPLKAHTGLKAYTPLKAHTRLKQTAPLKAKQKTARKLKTAYHSIFTDDMHKCVITGCTDGVVPHHIFDGPNKTFSERYGFILPLRSDWHTGYNYSIHKDRQLQLKYMYLCEDYWINTLHKTKDEWIAEAGRWWEERAA